MDTQELTRLLNASFQFWGVVARAEPMTRRSPAARIHVPGQPPFDIWYERSDRDFARWCCGANDSTAKDIDEAASIGALLKALRVRLDPGFLPSRAIIGIRPSETYDANSQ